MRGTSLTEIFNPPPAWSVFDPLVPDLTDLPYDIDPVEVLERLTKVLESYETMTRPRHFREKLGGKNSDQYADIYVFSTGLRRRGSMGHRVVRILPGAGLEVMDLDRVLDDSEIYKPRALRANHEKLSQLSRSYGNRLEATLRKSLPTLRRLLGNSAQWGDSIDFLIARDTKSFLFLEAPRILMADAMMQATEDLFPAENISLRNYIRRRLIECLESFDEKRLPQMNAMIGAAAGGLNPDMLEVLGRNPSSMTVRHYKWLNGAKTAEKAAFRLSLAQACPMVLLLDKYEDKIAGFESSGDIDTALQQIFHASPKRAAFYRNLSEAQVGNDMARRLDIAAEYIEGGAAANLPLNTRGDWDRVSILINASRSIGDLLQRPRGRIFNDCVADVLANPDDAFLSRLSFGRNFSEIRIYMNRLAAHALVPKIIIEGQLQGVTIPITHALYMASESSALDNTTAQSIPPKLRSMVQEQNENTRLVNLIMRGITVPRLIESAFYYGVHRGEYDEGLRNLIITNRMAEHGADYPWEKLPTVRMEEDNYTVVPLNSQSDLIKNSRETGDELWRQAPRAVIDGAHFVALRRAGGITDATAIIQEPKDAGGAWTIEDFVLADHGWRRNNLRDVFQAYVDMPEFQDQVDLRAIRATRRRLYTTLSQRAQANERIGMSDVSDLQERLLKLRVLGAHWPETPAFEIDDMGCISTPVINARVRALVTRVAPFYRKGAGLQAGMHPA